MKIICTQENLRGGLQIAGRIIGNTNTLPILNNVLLKTENGLLSIMSTNLEIGLRTEVRCKIEEPGEVCLPAKIITELVAALPAGNVKITTLDGGVEIKTENYTTKVHSLPSDEFPLIPHVERKNTVKLNAQEFKQAIESVIFAASTNETQPEISGMLLKQEAPGLRFVATDRYRLAEKTLALSGLETRDVIVPHRTVQEVARIIGPQTDTLELVVADTQVALFLPGTELVSRLVDGQYPEYQAIIPQQVITTALVDTQAFMNGLKTSGIFSRTTNSVSLEYNAEQQQIKVSASSSDLGESAITIPADIQGTTGVILLNHRYVVEALQTITDANVVIKIIDDDSPVIFTPQNDSTYLYLVMPIKN